jgi:hypothetical protein
LALFGWAILTGVAGVEAGVLTSERGTAAPFAAAFWAEELHSPKP